METSEGHSAIARAYPSSTSTRVTSCHDSRSVPLILWRRVETRWAQAVCQSGGCCECFSSCFGATPASTRAVATHHYPSEHFPLLQPPGKRRITVDLGLPHRLGPRAESGCRQSSGAGTNARPMSARGLGAALGASLRVGWVARPARRVHALLEEGQGLAALGKRGTQTRRQLAC